MYEKLVALMANYVEFDPETVNAGTRFAEDLGFNSYDYMCMLGDAEDAFDLEIDEAKGGKMKTVGELAEYLEELSA